MTSLGQDFINNPCTQTAYDAFGRVDGITAPDGSFTNYNYSALGAGASGVGVPVSVVEIQDARNNSTSQLSNAYGQLLKVIPPQASLAVTYSYDAMGNLILVDQPGDNVTTTIGYDKAGRKRWMRDPDMGEWSYTYDALGNLQSQTDAKEQTIWMGYDALNRLIEKRVTNSSGTLLASYTYDQGTHGNGHRTGMSDPSGSTAWTYDNRGRLIGETKTITGAGTYFTQWHYNSADQVDWMIYPGGNSGQPGEKVNFSYHNQGTLNRVWGSNTYVNSTSYDATGSITTRILGLDKLKTVFAYYPWATPNGMHRLWQIKTGLFAEADPTSLQNLVYTYDPVGNITRIDDTQGTTTEVLTFGPYDSMNRLTGATAAVGETINFSETYEYNPDTGNLEKKGGATLSYSAQFGTCPDGALTKPHAVTGVEINDVTYSNCYDPNGNMVERRNEDGTFTLTYDIANQLTGVSGSANETFVYDGDGNRVMTINGAERTVYIGSYFEETYNTTSVIPVPNPGFESSTSWVTTVEPAHPGTSAFRTTAGHYGAPHSGSYSFGISNNVYGWLQSNNLAVTPGQQFDVYAYVRGELDPTGSNGYGLIRVQFYTANDTYISYIDTARIDPGVVTTTWSQRGNRITVPANAAYLKILLYNYLNTGWVAFDNVEVYAISGGVPTGSNLITNPGFETTSGWTPTSNSGFPATSFYRGTWGTAAPYAGSWAYAISNHAYGVMSSSAIAVTAGSQYDVYAYVRGELDAADSEGLWLIRARYYRSDGSVLSYTDVDSGGGGSLTTAWTSQGGRITAPANAVSMKVQLYNYMNSGWVAYDDVEVYAIANGARTGSNRVLDPGFEASPSGWTLGGEANGQFPATSYLRSTWGSAAPHSGSYAYALGNLAYGLLTSDPVPVAEGQAYTLSAHLRGELDSESSGAWILRAVFYNASGDQLTWINAATGEASTVTPTWQALGGQVVAPTGATSMKVTLYSYMNAGWVTFDDVAVTLVSSRKVYYYAGGQRVALRENGALSYLLSDHLGSTAVVTDANGAETGRRRYSPWGEDRGTTGRLPTTFGYTGQRDDGYIKLLDFGSRWYDPHLGRFISPDTLIPIPSSPFAYDRYIYSNNNPINYTDPSGHIPVFIATGAIGAGVGAIIGGATYYLANQNTFDNGEFWTAVGGGAIAGGLAGSGLGLLSAATTTTAVATGASFMVGAGTASAVTEVDYMVSNPNAFESEPFIENAAIAGGVGGVSAICPLSPTGVALKGVTYIVGAEAQYALQTENWTVEGARQAAITGTVGALFDTASSYALDEMMMTNTSLGQDVWPSFSPGNPGIPNTVLPQAAAYRGMTGLLNAAGGLVSGSTSAAVLHRIRNQIERE